MPFPMNPKGQLQWGEHLQSTCIGDTGRCTSTLDGWLVVGGGWWVFEG